MLENLAALPLHKAFAIWSIILFSIFRISVKFILHIYILNYDHSLMLGIPKHGLPTSALLADLLA